MISRHSAKRRCLSFFVCLTLVLSIVPLGLAADAATVYINGSPYTASNDTYPVVTLTAADLQELDSVLFIEAPNNRVSINWPANWFSASDEVAVLFMNDYPLLIFDDMMTGLTTPTSFNIKMNAASSLTLGMTYNGSKPWYNYQYPVLLFKSHDAGSAMQQRVVVTKDGKPWARSLYQLDSKDGNNMEAKIYGGGTYGVSSSAVMPFSDVTTSHWAYKAVQFLNARGIVGGVGKNQYAPSRQITRAEFVTMLMRMLNINVSTAGTTPFPDAANTKEFYYSAALAAKKLGIVGGSGGKFNPDAKITRQDMFTMLARAIVKLKIANYMLPELAYETVAPFADANKIASYAKPEIELLAKLGIVNGSNGKVNPLANTTRAETAQLLANFINTDPDLY